MSSIGQKHRLDMQDKMENDWRPRNRREEEKPDWIRFYCWSVVSVLAFAEFIIWIEGAFR